MPSGTAMNPKAKHLFIVCTDPNDDDDVVLVSIASWRNDLCDGTCVLENGCHSFVRHKSYVFFRQARIEKSATLQRGLDQRVLFPDDDVSEEVLKAAAEGLLKSKQTPWQVVRFLKRAAKGPLIEGTKSVI